MGVKNFTEFFGTFKQCAVLAPLLAGLLSAPTKAPAAEGDVTVALSGFNTYSNSLGSLSIPTNAILTHTYTFNVNRLKPRSFFYIDYEGTTTFTAVAPGGTTNITTKGVTVDIYSDADGENFDLGNINLEDLEMYGGLIMPSGTIKETSSTIAEQIKDLANPLVTTKTWGSITGPTGNDEYFLAVRPSITAYSFYAPWMGVPQPSLNFSPTGAGLALSWPQCYSNSCVLWQKGGSSDAPWQQVTNAPQRIGDRFNLVIPQTNKMQLFRLGIPNTDQPTDLEFYENQ